MKRIIFYIFLLLNCPLGICHAQDAATEIKNLLTDYFAQYKNKAITSDNVVRLTDVVMDSTNQRHVTLYTNASYAEQPFTQETVKQIRQDIGKLLPPPYNTYEISILANGTPIEELIPTAWNVDAPDNRRWGNLKFKGYPWVKAIDNPIDIERGLEGHHIALWASHGKYFDQGKSTWQWQRPHLYCTTEDLFTQSFVLPFLIPMLENAGAVVFTPRERDWQRQEIIVDNDKANDKGKYIEKQGFHGWETGGMGFQDMQVFYTDGENPFTMGTFRKADTQTRKGEKSEIMWQPAIEKAGKYAVYVSYATLTTSVSDAEYTVWHRGIATPFRVNQKMGGGTWVYLGTFDFGTGNSHDNCVTLSNVSNYRGVITADAVRFGGGTGNIARCDSINPCCTSGILRSLEGSRYTAQWSGMPYEVYGNKQGTNDYAEDINVRSLMTNKLARGSVFLPGDSGLNVPIEMSLAVHSDAGFRRDSSIIGTLGIYTTGLHTPGEYESPLAEGLLPSRLSRLTSRDLCDVVMTQLDGDIRKVCGNWNRRQMYDRNYSETRVPEVPSMILETLSHQNFADLMRGHDPSFKMLMSRSIYKGILKYIAAIHKEKKLVTQPLPVKDFSAILSEHGDSVTLAWEATIDPTDESAEPSAYVIYKSAGNRGFDNGEKVRSNCVKLPIERNVLTRFIVRAANEGGLSMPSEELCVFSSWQERNRVLIVNGFHRLAGPQPIDNDSLRGFDMEIDPGVVYQHSPCYCGRQIFFNKNGYGGSGTTEIGYSGEELEGVVIAGNSFNYPSMHACDLLPGDSTLSISSCSNTALENGLATKSYQVIDLILGAQREDGYSMNARKSLTKGMCQILSDYAQKGGNLLLSGAYIGEEIAPSFAQNTLHLNVAGPYLLNDSTCLLSGLNTQFNIYCQPNEEQYAVRRLSSLIPTEGGFTLTTNQSHNASLAVAYPGERNRTLTFGFPLECIRESGIRQAVLRASLQFLLQK